MNEFFEIFSLGVELGFGLPVPATPSGQILVSERITYEVRRFRRGIGPRPTAEALKLWCEAHGVTWNEPWWPYFQRRP